eukprot:jgi/Picsp_1/741/NSC_04230-R1_atp-dependent dna helicase
MDQASRLPDFPASETAYAEMREAFEILLRKELHETFGYSEFRPFQLEAMISLASSKSVLLILACGAGKSLTYQAPCLVTKQFTVCVTPLLSLAQNQMDDAINSFGINAVLWASETSKEQRQKIAFDLVDPDGEIRVLYTTPESLLSPALADTLSIASEMGRIFCLAVDEAHVCESWGRDFRPSYLRLLEARRYLHDVPVIACTATANKYARGVIQEVLGIQESEVFVSSFNRPEIELNVEYKEVLQYEQGSSGGDAALHSIAKRIQHEPEMTGIVYCRHRSTCERLATILQNMDITSVEPYHAGLPDNVRKRNQARWQDGDIKVVVATIAFGLGINKPDVRWIYHYDVPSNLSEFYQEIGRAGRDGNRAVSVLFASKEDVDKAIKRDASNAEMADMIYGCVCRRKEIMQHFGERGLTCTESGATGKQQQLCDVCRSPSASAAKLEKLEHLLSEKAQGRMPHLSPAEIQMNTFRESVKRKLVEARASQDSVEEHAVHENSKVPCKSAFVKPRKVYVQRQYAFILLT